eukprot:5716177-Prorocentrum_lima.AAC.1
MVMCGNFASENQALRDFTQTQTVDMGLLRMVLSMTNGRHETFTTDIAHARLNTLLNKDTV